MTYPFEIHITVQTNELKRFKSFCKSIGVKPIVLSLQDSLGELVMHDVMTSSVIKTDVPGSIEESRNISQQLENAGFPVIRKKIETVPWHPIVPQTGSEPLPDNHYFESHLAFLVSSDVEVNLIRHRAAHHNLHISQNEFKKLDNGSSVIMGTYRKYDGGRENFENETTKIRDDFVDFGFNVDKMIVEYAFYDTKVSHDEAWINGRNNKDSIGRTL